MTAKKPTKKWLVHSRYDGSEYCTTKELALKAAQKMASYGSEGVIIAEIKNLVKFAIELEDVK